jgi:hypothetical protein
MITMIHLHQYRTGYGKELTDVHNVPLAPVSKRIRQGTYCSMFNVQCSQLKSFQGHGHSCPDLTMLA